jgi:hypothetical protein
MSILQAPMFIAPHPCLSTLLVAVPSHGLRMTAIGSMAPHSSVDQPAHASASGEPGAVGVRSP